jgi:hypothetical protein
MALADYQPLRRVIPFRGGEFSVRGIGLDDVAVLMHDYLSDIDRLFDLYDNSATKDLASAQFLVSLTREAPALVGTLIALACDEPNNVEQARKLSLPVQIEALKAILELTFEEAGGYRKFFESLGNLLKTLAPAHQQTDSRT